MSNKYLDVGVNMMNKRVGLELRSLNNEISRFIDNHLNRKKIQKITGTNGWIIGYISENSHRDVFQKEFEKKFGITRSTASKVVNLMVQKGLIERQNVESDARLKKLVLTEKSNEISKIMEEDGKVIEKVLTKGFSDDELEQLYGYIRRMRENIKNKAE